MKIQIQIMSGLVHHLICLVVCHLSLQTLAAEPYEAYGIDTEIPVCMHLGSSSTCSDENLYKTINAQWVRLFVPWQNIEPQAPVGPGNPNIPGQKSGVHTYNWAGSFVAFNNSLDGMVKSALDSGAQIYLQIFWIPNWANGSPYSNCNPVAGSQCMINGKPVGNPQGHLPTNTAYLEDFAYNLAKHLGNKVKYFGPLNEPNLTTNFNPFDQQELINKGQNGINWAVSNYMNYIVAPVHAGIKAASAENLLVGPDLAYGIGSDAINVWLKRLSTYYANYFDIWSFHTYRSDHNKVKKDMINFHQALITSNPATANTPIWLTETGFDPGSGVDEANNLSSQIQQIYVDEHNLYFGVQTQAIPWAKTFYHPKGNTDPFNALVYGWNFPQPANNYQNVLNTYRRMSDKKY